MSMVTGRSELYPYLLQLQMDTVTKINCYYCSRYRFLTGSRERISGRCYYITTIIYYLLYSLLMLQELLQDASLR